MKKFTFYRSAIVGETYEIEAETEEAAREILYSYPDPVHSDFLDWYTDEFQLEDVEDVA